MEKINLFVLYNKNSNGLLKDFWGMKNKRTSLLMWSEVDNLMPSVCVSFNTVDHSQQPMEIHTEVTLLYNCP